MMTRKAGLLVFLFVFAFTSLSYAQNKDSKQSYGVYPDLGLGVVFGGTFDLLPRIGRTVSNVPADVRSLPSHQYDSWIYRRGPVTRTIPFDTINPDTVDTINGFIFGPELTFRRLRLRGGLKFSFLNDTDDIDRGLCRCNYGATREVNQHGSPNRGYGTSLVYYNMWPTHSNVPGYFLETSFNVSNYASLMAGTSLSHYGYMVETGYDRYNRLEEYDTRKAGRAGVRTAYWGVEAELPLSSSTDPVLGKVGYQFLAGRVIDDIRTNNGMLVSIEGERPWFFKMGLVFHISSR